MTANSRPLAQVKRFETAFADPIARSVLARSRRGQQAGFAITAGPPATCTPPVTDTCSRQHGHDAVSATCQAAGAELPRARQMGVLPHLRAQPRKMDDTK